MNRLYTFIIVGLLFVTGVHAQSVTASGVMVVNAKAAVQNDSLYVDMNMDLAKVNIKSKDGVILTPVIQSPQQSLELPAVFVGGRNKYKAFNRKQAFGGNEVVFVSLRAKDDETSVINYTYPLPYEPWMENASLLLREEIYGCADCRKSQNDISLLANIDLMVRPLLVTYIVPPVEKVKNRNLSGKAFLDFQVNKAVILPDFRNNPSELRKIRDVVMEVKDNKYATVSSIDLTGYASPEGPYELNEKLSKERSFALKDYLQNTYGFKTDLFNVSWKGEDWEGLKKQIETSDLKEKPELLDIINSSVSDAARDLAVKKLARGTVYKTLLNEYYPSLRRVEYKLNYVVKSFTLEESVEIFKTAPAQLSLNELFMIAGKYDKGSKEFNDVFDVAVRIYPLDPVANINAAATELEKGDAKQAHRFLDKYADNPQAWNNIGVMYLMEGDYAQAAEFLQKALKVNKEEALYNLQQLKIRSRLPKP